MQMGTKGLQNRWVRFALLFFLAGSTISALASDLDALRGTWVVGVTVQLNQSKYGKAPELKRLVFDRNVLYQIGAGGSSTPCYFQLGNQGNLKTIDLYDASHRAYAIYSLQGNTLTIGVGRFGARPGSFNLDDNNVVYLITATRLGSAGNGVTPTNGTLTARTIITIHVGPWTGKTPTSPVAPTPSTSRVTPTNPLAMPPVHRPSSTSPKAALSSATPTPTRAAPPRSPAPTTKPSLPTPPRPTPRKTVTGPVPEPVIPGDGQGANLIGPDSSPLD